jgi:hypothetical protein
MALTPESKLKTLIRTPAVGVKILGKWKSADEIVSP